MKNNIDYYRHDSNAHNHAKFKVLRVKYGWAGEGRFWALNNMISAAENCWLNLNEEFNRFSIANDLGMTIEEFDDFIIYLTEKCKLLINNDGLITTEMVQETLKMLMSDREAARLRKLGKKPSSPESVKSSGELSKSSEVVREAVGRTEQESKVKESKVKESISSPPPGRDDNNPEIIQSPTFDEFWDVYDKKVDRQSAEKKWKKLSHPERELAMAYIPRYKISQPDKQFRKNPEAFLNNKAWQNELILPEQQKTSANKPANKTKTGMVF